MNYLRKDLIIAILLIVLISIEADNVKKSFELHGIYLECCTCHLVCTCDLKGEMVQGCHLMGAMIISSGSYSNHDLAGVKIAFAVSNKWARIYIQSEDSVKFKAAAEMGQKLFTPDVPVEKIIKSEISLSGIDGAYTLKVNDGKIINLETQPILGADQKTAVTYTNYPRLFFNTIMQAKVVSGKYNDDKRNFNLEGTNSFFNQNWVASGKI